jgi:hypothetical protein
VPHKQVLSWRLQPIHARLRVSRESSSRPAADRSGQVRVAFVPVQRSWSHGHGSSQAGAPQLRRSYRVEWRAVSRPPGSRRRKGKRESGVRSGVMPGWRAPWQRGLECEGGRTRGCSRRGAVGGEPEHHRRPSHREPGQGRAPLAADPQCSTPRGGDDEAEAVPGVDTARWFEIGSTGCAAPNVQTGVAGNVRAARRGSQPAAFRPGPAADLH